MKWNESSSCFLVWITAMIALSACSTSRILPKPVESHRKGLLQQWSELEPAFRIPAKERFRTSIRHASSRTHQVAMEGLHWPLHFVQVTSPFGPRGREFHEGLDLRAAPGTPVFAAQRGVVLYAGENIRGYGKMVVIRHVGKVSTIYAHNSKILVQPGEQVKQGQVIAMSGKTGHTHGPHLHFEIRQGTSALNPLSCLPSI